MPPVPAQSQDINNPVTVDVVATDKRGIRITDLKPEEIQISADGVHLPAELFRPSSSPQRVAGPDATAPQIFRSVPPGSCSNLVPAPLSQTAPLVIVLADVLNTPADMRDRLRNTFAGLLDQMDSNSHVTIYGLTGSLRVLEDSAGDPSVLSAAMRSVQKRSADFSTARTADSGRVLPPPASSTESPTEFLQTVEDFKTFQTYPDLDDRITTTLSALGGIARQFERTPGRKALIWLTGDYPCIFIPPILEPGQQCGSLEEMRAEVFRRLQQAHIAVYPVTTPVRERKSSEVTDAANAFGRSPSPTVVLAPPPHEQNTFKRDLVVNSTVVKTIAEATGGRVLDTAHLQKALELARSDCRDYFQLVLPATDPTAGYHKLNITTTRHDVSLLFPHGRYGDRPGPAPLWTPTIANELEDALINDRLQSAGVPMMARKQPGAAAIELFVDARALTFLEQVDGRYAISFDLAVAVFSPSYRPLAANIDPMKRVFTSDRMNAARSNGLLLHAFYPENERARYVRVLIRDSGSGRIGTVDVPIECKACNVLHAEAHPE
ncbi:MAG TPA: VWA domain-containing protein [Candidatus Angelobacter sp.]|nr:VWA domain-containing protein [Candidatus Angelobacter sp.]